MRAWIFALPFLVACGSSGDASDASEESSPTNDATTKDVTAMDSTMMDSSSMDASMDASSMDASSSDADASASDASDGSIILDAGPPDVVNGCSTNNDCNKSDYCEKGNNNCNGSGSCMVRPQICPLLYNPVCGCDKKTYSNSCYAHAGGTSVWYSGQCE